jgi:hypothetical protein
VLGAVAGDDGIRRISYLDRYESGDYRGSLTQWIFDEYTIEVADGWVTHWMPLPDPPGDRAEEGETPGNYYVKTGEVSMPPFGS